MATINSEELDFSLSGKSDHYTSHLAQVTVRKGNKIITTEDIHNEHGVLLLRKGAVLNDKAAQKIINHKLVNPIEEDIAIERTLNGKQMAEHFIALQDKYPDIKKINEAHHFEKEIIDLFTKRRLPPVLFQKLTILYEQLPKSFEKALFSAWLSSLIADKMNLNHYDIYDVFIAGLIHDLGFIHLDPEIVLADRELTPAEWRTIQSHVVVGKIVIESIPDISKNIARAVLEHHENCDGSGYPTAKMQKDILPISHIISMVDSIYAIRTNQFEKEGRSLADIFPYLQLNYTTHSLEVYRAAYRIIKDADLTHSHLNSHGSLEKYTANILNRSEIIHCIIPDLVKSLENLLDIQQYQNNKNAQTIISVTTRMLTMLTMSGLLFDTHMQWLSEMANKAKDNILDELNQNDLMLQELNWQLRNTHRFLKLFSEDITDTNEKEQLSLDQSISNLENCLDKLNKVGAEQQ
ncbi:MAG: HD domain-containing protein [Gammaproteobacteria bacterium]|nr:HD domain-containing protein [Gammaproteobacteria bacterium]